VLAEDDCDFRQLLAGILRADGYEVIEARNGADLADCLAFSIQHSTLFQYPDLVITDVRMPCLSGLDVLATLEQDGHRTRTVVITAFGSQETHEKARALGAVAVFDKPFDIDDLRREVARQLTDAA
jgi:CheY-like chemotaxis protein